MSGALWAHDHNLQIDYPRVVPAWHTALGFIAYVFSRPPGLQVNISFRVQHPQSHDTSIAT